jgi:GMP synthase-like glutamine amidotransferase
MSHSDSIKALPTNGEVSTHDVEFVAYKIEGDTYAIQYHLKYFNQMVLKC